MVFLIQNGLMLVINFCVLWFVSEMWYTIDDSTSEQLYSS